MKRQNLAVWTLFVLITLWILPAANIVSAGTLKDPVRIMPLGDSITRGVAGSSDDTGYRRSLYLALTGAGHSVDFVGGQTDGIPTDFDRSHEGHDGWHADQIRDNIYGWLVANPADVVLLHIGTNDVSGGDEDAAEVAAILDNIDLYELDYGQQVTVFVARIILRNDAKNPQTIAYNDAVEAQVVSRGAGGDQIDGLDMQSALAYPGDLADTVHPNDAGYQDMADTWFAALDTFLRGPGVDNLTLSSTSGNGYDGDHLTCSYSLTGGATTAAAAWTVDSSPLMAFYLPMEGDEPAALDDYSGNSITAVKHGDPTWGSTAGHDGFGAYVFDGNDDLGGGENFPTGSSYTKTAWVYRTGSGNNGGNNVISGDANAGGHAFWAPDMFANKLSAGHNGTWDSVQDAVALSLNTWHFVAVTWDDATDLMTLYKNGVEVDQATVSANVTDATISVGSFGYGNGYMWLGTIDEPRIYNRALSAEQIAALYDAGTGNANTIVPEETSVAEQWQAQVTPFSAAEAGTTSATNTVTILADVPAAPSIISTPLTAATVDELYSYDVDATGFPAPTYSLSTFPTGMTVNPTSGLITWIPTSGQEGLNPVEVVAMNVSGSDTQSFDVDVSPAPVPEIENLALTSTSGNDYTTDDLNCTYDLAGNATTAATAWTLDGAPLMEFYLPMEGGEPAALDDYSGNSITAVKHGDPTWGATAGHDGHGAYVFDGNDDLGGGEHFPAGSSYTKTAWVYRTGSGNNGGNNIISGDVDPGGHAFWAPDMFGNMLSAGHNGTWNSVQDAVALSLNTWHFVAVTWDDATDLMTLYKNGVEVDQATVSANVTDATVSIGSFGYSNGWMWQGTIDDPRIYDRALSAGQIAALYNAGAGDATTIVWQETDVGDQWQAQVTPFSATAAGSTTPSNTLTIVGTSVPPVITSTPMTTGTVGSPYSYDVDASGYPAPTYSLLTFPAGMTIAPVSGVIDWTPAAGQEGLNPVEVVATNTAGADTQSFDVDVAPLLVPEIENLVLTSTSGNDYTTDDLTCSYDLAGSTTTAATAWYKDAAPLMIAYLPMEGGAANALLDYSGSGHNGATAGDPTWSATGGADGHGAFYFDGNDHIDLGNVFPTAAYTKTAWIWWEAGQNHNNIISGQTNHAFWVFDSGGYRLTAGHNGAWDTVADPALFTAGVWTFVAVTFDPAVGGGTMILYKNGVEVDSATGVANINADTRAYIGSYSGGCCWFRGWLDDTRIYGRALSPEQIAAMYDSGAGDANTIVSQETDVDDQWQARVTPFSATEAGSTYESNTLTIVTETPEAPVITSTPVTTAMVGLAYAYDVDATGSPAPTYSLLILPTGMDIDSGTGAIAWIPQAGQEGLNAVQVVATNTAGADTQSFDIDVASGPAVENVTLTSSSGFDYTTDDLSCTYDLAGSATTAATAFFKNDAPLMAFYLPMEGDEPAALTDHSGNGITATKHGDPTWNATGGHDGFGAYVFDGEEGLSGGENFPTGSSYSKTAWVYRTGSGANGGNNIISGDVDPGGHALWAPDLYGNRLSAGHNGTWNSVQDEVALALDTWYFVAVTWDDATDRMILYKNGAPIDTATVSVNVTDPTISVGSFGPINGWMWQGTIDDARIYNVVLAPEQVAALYGAGAGDNDTIVSQQTQIGEEWHACVVPFAPVLAGAAACSDTLTIQDPTGVDPTEDGGLPAMTSLVGAWPNPFNPSTTVQFNVHRTGPVTVRVYDTQGRLVRTLVNEARVAGHHTVTWDGRSDSGRAAGSGVYFLRMEAGSYAATAKAVLVK
jgi:lysophospholipase L1-like esterase